MHFVTAARALSHWAISFAMTYVTKKTLTRENEHTTLPTRDANVKGPLPVQDDKPYLPIL